MGRYDLGLIAVLCLIGLVYMLAGLIYLVMAAIPIGYFYLIWLRADHWVEFAAIVVMHILIGGPLVLIAGLINEHKWLDHSNLAAG